MAEKIGLTFVFTILIILFTLNGIKYGEKRIVNNLCQKYKYDFCEEIRSETIYVLKEDFLNGDN